MVNRENFSECDESFMDVSISMNTDCDGFLSQECPACTGRFKAKFGEGSDQPISFCPYCCHMGQRCWWTPEQAAYIGAMGQNAASGLVADELDKMAKKINRQSKSGLIKIKMTTERARPQRAVAPAEPDDKMSVFDFPCCGERIKHNSVQDKLFCVICGNEHTVSIG